MAGGATLPEPASRPSAVIEVKLIAPSTVTDQTHTYLGEPGALPFPWWNITVVAAA